jgi:hypothetical protein
VYGQQAVLPVEINLQTCRVTNQDALSVAEYTKLMMGVVDEVLESQFRALREIKRKENKDG